jgi:hypothetical protein
MLDPLSETSLKAELMKVLLAHGNRWMTIHELAHAVNQRGKYRKRDRSALTPYDVHVRSLNYPEIFDRGGTSLRLSSP